MEKLTPPIKRHGGKGAFNGKLANWIISKMPPRAKNSNKPADDDPGWVHYCEPYFGGGAVLLAQDPVGISECVNDLDGNLTNLWRVLQSEAMFATFQRIMEGTKFGESEFENACKALAEQRPYNDGDLGDVARASWYFIVCRQSMAGRNDSFAPLTQNRTRRQMNEQVSAWLTAVEGLPEVHARIKRVAVLGPRDGVKVIKQQDTKRTLFYSDPPYVHESRGKGSTDVYEHEMSVEQHHDLLNTLSKIEGRFLLSGYHSDLYDNFAKIWKWSCHEFEIVNNSASGKKKENKTEVLWTNY